MKTFNKISLLFAFLFLLAQAIVINAQTEDCYLPVRSPTMQDKKNFIEQISKLAVEAEKKHGVPAPAIAGMAILESGYGLTRLSMDAKNIFGFKKVKGKKTYTLTCQPSWDVGNEYIKFDSWAEAMDYVASRLASSDFYRADTEKYKAEIAAGTDRKTAAINWLMGISDPYNYDPPEYVIKVKKCVNDPYKWSEQIDEKTNLWKLSPINPNNESSSNNQTKLAQVEKRYADLIAAGGRYMESKTGCKPMTKSNEDTPLNKILNPYFDYLSENNLPFKIQDCTYTNLGITGRVIMLNVDANQLARWTVNACQPKVSDTCINRVIDNIWGGNGAQFPITGTVIEKSRSKDIDCTQVEKGGFPALYAFRDGVTVSVKSFRPTADKGAICTNNKLLREQLEAVLTEPVVKTSLVIRIASVSRTKTTDSEYLSFARNSYLEALGKDEYKILKSWVIENIK